MAYPFLQARWFTATSNRAIDLIVIHTMEAPEKGMTAENVARYFQTTETKASAHYCIDNNSIVQCVLDQHVAYAAPGGNHNGLHFEHAGYARQSAAEWDDPYSQAMLAVSARLAAEKARAYNIPAVWLSPAELRARKRGFTSHLHVSQAFKRSTHTDPGPSFPHGLYLDQVRSALGQPPGSDHAGGTHPELKRGDAGEGVRHLQKLLGGLTVDGEFGPVTEQRLKEVQTRLRLSVTGRCDETAWAHLHPVLRQGDSGLSVQELQAILIARGIAPELTVDGDFGPKTAQAVLRFKGDNGLANEEIVGPTTWNALLGISR